MNAREREALSEEKYFQRVRRRSKPPIFDAIEKGSLNEVTQFLESDPELLVKETKTGDTPISFAIDTITDKIDFKNILLHFVY